MACANAAGIGEALKEFVTKNKEQNGELLSNFIWGKMKKMNIGDYILEYKGNKRDVMYAANVDRIIVVRPPASPDWEAVRDRLTRAAAATKPSGQI